MKINSVCLEESKSSPGIRVFDIAELSRYDGPGIRTVVYLQGCSAGCEWCHSPHSQSSVSPLMFLSSLCTACHRCVDACKQGVHKFINMKHCIDRSKCIQCGNCIKECPASVSGVSGSALSLPTAYATVDSLWEQIYPYLLLTKKSGGGITLSGGEALLQPQASIELLRRCREAGIHTSVETSGLLPVTIYRNVAPLVDTWMFGMRVITGKNHPRHDDHIRQVMTELAKHKCSILPRIPMVPGFYDCDDVLHSILSLLQQYHIDSIYLNPWNRNFDVNYYNSGIPLKMTVPSAREVATCESKIVSFFTHFKFDLYE